MSNYCACSGGDEEYTIELNQQGPEGPQGSVGPEGFSPSISVKTNTDKAYILTVVNKEGTFDTPNLYGETEKLNADLSNIPNPAYINGVSLSSIENNISMITMDSSRITTDVDGNLILNATASNEESMEVFNYEVVANPKEQRLELHDNEGNVKIVATTDYIPTIGVATTTTAGVVKPDGRTITVTPDGTISAVQQDLSNLATKEELASTDATVTSIQTSLNNKLESSNIIAGANVTISRDGNNLTISSTSGGGGGGGVSIDDSTTSSASTWSSSKINSEITSAVDTINSTKNDNIFDISKFTVVGTPTITDDGVASGFSTGNCLRTSTIDFTKPWKIESKFRLNKMSEQMLWAIQGGGWFDYIYISAAAELLFTFKTSDDVALRLKLDAGIVTTNVDYLYIVGWTGTEYYVELLHDNAIIQRLSLSSTLTLNITSGYVQLGYGSSGFYILDGSIDLSHFSITVDDEVIFNGLMESTKPIYDKITSTSTALSTFQTDTDNNFSAVNSALNEKANLSDLAGYVPLTKYNELLARVVALETEINGGNA